MIDFEVAVRKRPNFIDRMAYEAAGRGAHFDCDRAWLYRFAEMLADECARVIEAQDVDPSFKGRIAWAVRDKFKQKEE
jgi:hypothetical protein